MSRSSVNEQRASIVSSFVFTSSEEASLQGASARTIGRPTHCLAVFGARYPPPSSSPGLSILADTKERPRCRHIVCFRVRASRSSLSVVVSETGEEEQRVESRVVVIAAVGDSSITCGVFSALELSPPLSFCPLPLRAMAATTPKIQIVRLH